MDNKTCLKPPTSIYIYMVVSLEQLVVSLGKAPVTVRLCLGEVMVKPMDMPASGSSDIPELLTCIDMYVYMYSIYSICIVYV